MKRKIIIAITGASGSIYAKVLLNKLQILNKQVEDVSVVMSDNAKDVWKHELGSFLCPSSPKLQDCTLFRRSQTGL